MDGGNGTRPQNSKAAMNTDSPDDSEVQIDKPHRRYDELQVDDDVVIYDRENYQAWIQSSVAINLADH